MIETKGLTKYYGDFPAITDVTFQVEKGEILGFLGPNGAGKTTTMKILTGFMPPTSGSAAIAGYDVVTNSLEARRRIGYLPETVPLYTDMTVEDYLEFMGTIRGMNKKRIRQRIPEVIEICRLGEYQGTLIGKLSKGFRQRTGIAQAILHEPEVLILDEPTIGIDPIQVVETRQLIKGLGKEHTLIISTHILPEVSMLCQRVIIIHEGQVIAVDSPENLAQRLQGTERIIIEVRGPSRDIIATLRNVPGVQNVGRIATITDGVNSYAIDSKRGTDLREKIATTIVQKSWGLLRLETESMTLEEIFLKLTTSEDLKGGQ
ncbi:MAG: ATP-binding cassette domain-containing protein [Chloroflexi bacterium]|nr:ATP-binding cassette domain-containing protein [Chloroflexota bacterium]